MGYLRAGPRTSARGGMLRAEKNALNYVNNQALWYVGGLTLSTEGNDSRRRHSRCRADDVGKL